MTEEVDRKTSLDLGYYENFLSRLEEADIPQIHEPGHISGRYNAQFLEVLGKSRRLMRLELRDQLKTQGSLDDGDLTKIINDSDTFTLYAKGQGWLNDEIEKAWREYKVNYLNEIMSVEEKNAELFRTPSVKPRRSLKFLLIPASILLVGAGLIGYFEYKAGEMDESIDNRIEMTTNAVEYRVEKKLKKEKEKLVKEFFEKHYPRIEKMQYEKQQQYLNDFIANIDMPEKWRKDFQETISEAIEQIWKDPQKRKEVLKSFLGGD